MRAPSSLASGTRLGSRTSHRRRPCRFVFHELLVEHDYDHEFEVVDGVGHDGMRLFDLVGIKGLQFQARAGSGGAGQVAYPLTHYGLEDRIALAVPWTGFWMGRIDIGCLDDAPRNAELHFGDAARRAIDLTYGYSAEEAGACSSRNEAFRSRFEEASLSVDADLHYPDTLVWHVLAGADEVGALGHGLTYYDAMLRAASPHVRVDVLPGLAHGLRGPTDAGMNKIRDVMLQECVLRR